ncbi:3-phosphoshikimate 1-carboxyvinyltransferase [Rhodothermaceae bacterium RA]|nr:3-phosphoshikimate 1-carboxyvinyltransferase [Rhodothermaceae bacterium RA]
MTQHVTPAARLRGRVDLPADKSIAHRAALLAALADGTSHLVDYPSAADPQSTLACLRRLGVAIEPRGDLLQVQGVGLEGLHPPDGPLDCGNSGTTMRLLAGILAGQTFDTTLVGDASLSRRPMQRIAHPLAAMGARLDLTDGHAPIHIRGGRRLHGIEYPLPVPSAQVKSCVLLAGLFAEGETTVIETLPSRDHTERMLGLSAIDVDGRRYLTVEGGRRIAARTWMIPRDFSAAAFFLVAGAIVPDAEIHLPGVGLNPSRSALLDVLRAMGANITVKSERTRGGEPIADLAVSTSELRGVSVGGAIVPNLIDEIPILAVAAACAAGRTEIRDAGELRVKETDRLAAMATNLRALGARVEENEDGLVIEGGRPLHGAEVDSFDDHRIAMAMGVAGLVAEGTTTVHDADCARISFPGFWTALEHLRDG